MNDSPITINKDQNGKFIACWRVQFLKDIYTSPIYKCDNFSFRITFTNPNLSKDERISVGCNFWDFTYYKYSIQYNMLIFNSNDPENDTYCSSGIFGPIKNNFEQYFNFRKDFDKEQAKSIFSTLLESSNQEMDPFISDLPIYYFYFELQMLEKTDNLIRWFIPTEEINEFHLIPEPISSPNYDANCVLSQNEKGYFSFQFFFFNIKKSEMPIYLITLHNKDPKMDGSLKFTAITSTSKECIETPLRPIFITQDELLDETNGWIFDGGLHMTINTNAKYLKYVPRLFSQTAPTKKLEQNTVVSPSPEESFSKPFQNQIKENTSYEKTSNCESVDYYSIKLNEDSKYCKEENLLCKQKNILIPSNGKYIVCLNLNKSMFNNSEQMGIYTSPSYVTELNNNEFQIIINLNEKKLFVKSKDSSLPFMFNVKYSNKENSEILSPNGQEIDIPFDLNTAFEPNDWLYSRKNDNCFIYDCYNVVLPKDTYSCYLKIFVEIRYIENMVDGINFQHIESNSSVTILTLNIPTDALVLKDNQLEMPKLYFPKISYKSTNSDYYSVIKPELIIHTNEAGYNELLYFEIIINREESKYPIFLTTSFMKHSIKKTEDELVKHHKYQYAINEIRRFSFSVQFKFSTLDDYQFIESNNESYFKLKLVMIAGEYIPGQKVPPIDISKIEQRKDNHNDRRENIPPKKRNSMIKNKMYYPKYTEEGINKQIEALTKEAETIDSSSNNNSIKRNINQPYAGLKNQGATCYMNSILQSLFHLPAFRKIVYEMPTTGNEDVTKSIPLNLQRLFFDLQFSNSSISTEDLTKSFGWGSVETFSQHDSQEFLRVLLENLMEKMKKANLPDEIPNLFKGKIRRYIKCLNVQYESNHEDEFYDISVPVKNLSKLEDSFESYIKPQELNGKNQYKTEQYGLQDAITGEEFLAFPPILITHLTRFEYNITSGRQEKINDRFEFPTTIDMTKYLAKDAPGISNDNTYDLYGVIVHSGTSQGGHYYAFLKTNPDNSNHGQWYQFNDSSVSKDTEERAVRDNYGGYIGDNSHDRDEGNDRITNGYYQLDRLSEGEHALDDYWREIHSSKPNSDSDSDSDQDDRHRIHDPMDRHNRHRHHELGGHRHSRDKRERFMESLNNFNRIEREFSREKYISKEMMRRDHHYPGEYDHEMMRRNHHYQDEIVNRRERSSKLTPISHSAYILIYVRRDEAARIFQPIKDEDVPQHLKDYMKNKEKEKILAKIREIQDEFDSQIKSVSLYMMNENILSDFCKKKITGWDEQDNVERACKMSNSLKLQVIDFDVNMKCDELYTRIAQLYNLNRNEIRIWRCNIVDNFPLKIIPDSDKSNLGGIRHQKKGGKMLIMIQVRTEENSIHYNDTKSNVAIETTENKESQENTTTETTENKESQENATTETTENKESQENTTTETTENKEANSNENENKEPQENTPTETTENKEPQENTTTENKESQENANTETTENKETNSNENENKEPHENTKATETTSINETEKDTSLPLDINNNLMLYIKFFFPALKHSPLKFIGSILLDLNEDNNKGSDRLSTRLTPIVNKMIGFPPDTKLDAFTERTQDVVKLDLERSVTSIKNDYSFRNGSILIFQQSSESSKLPVPTKYLTADEEEEEKEKTEPATTNETSTNTTDHLKTQKVPLFHWEGSKFTSSQSHSSITDFITQSTNGLRLEIRNIDDFNKPVARIITNRNIKFTELQDFIHDKLLCNNKKEKKEETKKEEKEIKNESETETETETTVDMFYNKEIKNKNQSSTDKKDEEKTGKLVQPGEDGPLLFFLVKIFEQESANDTKPPLKVASIDTFKKQIVNDIFGNNVFSGHKRKYKVMKVDVNEEDDNELKNTSFFILGFYEFKAYYGDKKEMKEYKTQYSENACSYNYELHFKSPLKLCMIDLILLNLKINRALNIIGETIYPQKYNSHSIQEKIEPDKYRVLLINPSLIVEYYYDLLAYTDPRYMFMTFRVEKIPEDQIGNENNNLMKVCFGYNHVISSNNTKPLVITKYYGAPFLFKVIKDEIFKDSKERLTNITGESLEVFTFRLRLNTIYDFDELPLVKDDDYLFELMKKSKELMIVPAFPPESNYIPTSSTPKTNNDDTKPKNDENHSRKPEQTRRNQNSIKIYN